jgi:hypothetical protein
VSCPVFRFTELPPSLCLVVIAPPVRVLFLLIWATLVQILVVTMGLVFPLGIDDGFVGWLRLLLAASHGYWRSDCHCEQERGEAPK